MDPSPLLIKAAEENWESWSPDQVPQRGLVHWKTLISGDKTPSNELTLGLCEIAPEQALHRHRHAPAEIYYILEGTGSMEINGSTQGVEAGSAVFIPGHATHGITNIGSTPLKFLYAFATDSFESVEYIFEDSEA